MKKFKLYDEVVLTKDFEQMISFNDKSYIYKLDKYRLFQITEVNDNLYKLESNSDIYIFDDNLMQEYFEIRHSINNYSEHELNKDCMKAFSIANNAIYFNDKHDYLSALYEICKTLNPKLNEELIGNKYIEEK